MKLELWNTRSGPEEKGYAKIIPLKNSKNSILDDIKNIIEQSSRIETFEQLPPPISFKGSDKICENCEYCNLALKIYGKETDEIIDIDMNFNDHVNTNNRNQNNNPNKTTKKNLLSFVNDK